MIRKEILKETKYFTLYRWKSISTGRRASKWYYMISVDADHRFRHFSWSDMENIRDMVDPHRNKSGRDSYSWKYRTLVDAERVFFTLVLRWT